jgi:hypothetical protein
MAPPLLMIPSNILTSVVTNVSQRRRVHLPLFRASPINPHNLRT